MSQKKEIERLIASASEGKIGVVQHLLDVGIDVDAQDRNGNRAINLACVNGHIEIVKLLIDKGAEINTSDEIGRNPMIAATEGNHVDIIEYLLSQGADVDGRGEGGRTPLMECANSYSPQAAKILIKSGTNINARSENGSTALHEAIFSACEDYMEPEENELIPLLIESGADTQQEDNEGISPLDLAEQYSEEIDYRDILSKS